jgi:hypothetical protein
MAGLKPGEEVEIVRYPEEKSIFDLLGGGRDEEASAALVAQSLGVPVKTIRKLSLPAFLFRTETRAAPKLYYWAPLPEVH